MNAPPDDKIVVGSEEWLALPELGIPAIKARVDSGAKTSSLHAFNIRGFKRDGVSWVSYELHPLQKDRQVIVRCESEVADRRVVKSSSGVGEKRYVIRTQLELGGERWDVEITLANRDSMGYRMLFGREAMKNRILVDPSASQLCGNRSQEEIESLYGQADSLVGLKIGLLASNPRLYSNQRIMEAARERGHEIQFIDVQQCTMKLDADNPEIHYGRGKTLNDLDCVIPRIKPGMTRFGCALIRHFESNGIVSLNTARSVTQARDKLHMLQLMIEQGVPLPSSALANAPRDISDLLDMLEGTPLVVKMLQSAHSDGVVSAETREAAESVIKAFRTAGSELLIQEFIQEASGTDLRVLVVDNRVVAAMERLAVMDEHGVSIQRGAPGTAARLSIAEKRLALRAAKAVGLRVAGVDIIRSDRGPLLLDINATPELKEIEKATGKDLAGTLIHAVEKKLRWKRPLHSGETGAG